MASVQKSAKQYLTFDATRSFDTSVTTTDGGDEEDRLESLEAAPLLLLPSTPKPQDDLKDVQESHRIVTGSALRSNTLCSREPLIDCGTSKDSNHSFSMIRPGSQPYRTWWTINVLAAVATVFFETYVIAFSSTGQLTYPFTGKYAFIEWCLTGIFVADIGVNFQLGYYNNSKDDELVVAKPEIAKQYWTNRFWIDLVSVLPLEFLALWSTGNLGKETRLTNTFSLLRLVRLLRVYKVWEYFEALQLDTSISLFHLTLIRNLAAALVWTHLAACLLYFVAKQSVLRDDSQPPSKNFLGEDFHSMNEYDSYIASLYWSVVTFATVGYGDFVPTNAAEQLWTIVYTLSNLVLQAWIIGSITLLIIKKDETTGHYRDTLETLDKYSTLHSFDDHFRNKLAAQLRLDFRTREIADESVLKCFPTSVRRKVLRKLYAPYLFHTHLMAGVRQQFVDAFLAACAVEIFSPGEEILQRNAVASDLYLLVGGIVRYSHHTIGNEKVNSNTIHGSNDKEKHADNPNLRAQDHKAGDFLNEIGFFTESPQIDTVTTVTVCKTLTISRSTYKLLAQDHPGSSGKILQNLLLKVTKSMPLQSDIPVSLGQLRAGSMFFNDNQQNGGGDSSHHNSGPEYKRTNSMLSESSFGSVPLASTTPSLALVAVEDLVKMHIEKQKDDHTTRFLFAASRGDTNTISVMCDQGFDPNCTDYDSRSALMVAAMKGNTEVVVKLLGYSANPNLVDMHGSSALYEAARNGHEDTMAALLEQGAELCMADSLAASVLDQAVFDGDIPLLRRLLRARIHVDAPDYDKRRAVHLAAAEGNLAALRLLVESGANLEVRDRWGNSVRDEAERAQAGTLLAYLQTIEADQKG